MWRNDGVALIDEVDTVLHPLKSELNFPVGDKSDLDLAQARWELPMLLVKSMLSAAKLDGSVLDAGENIKNLAEKIKVGIEGCSITFSPDVGLVLLDKNFFMREMKDTIANICIQWLKKQIPVSEDMDRAGIPDIGPYLKRYILGQERTLSTAAEVNIQFSEASIALANLSKKWTGSFLPHIFTKARSRILISAIESVSAHSNLLFPCSAIEWNSGSYSSMTSSDSTSWIWTRRKLWGSMTRMKIRKSSG